MNFTPENITPTELEAYENSIRNYMTPMIVEAEEESDLKDFWEIQTCQQLIIEFKDIKTKLSNNSLTTEDQDKIKSRTENDIFKALILSKSEIPLEKADKGDSSVEVCCERWGTIPSLRLNNFDIFYNDPELRNNPEKNIREWFYMWPVAWNLPQATQEELWFNLKQHGFLRNVKWNLIENSNWIVIMEYIHNSEQKDFENFPFNFNAKQTIEIDNNSAKFWLELTNLDNKIMPFSPWHHTYYQVNPEQKLDVTLSKNIDLSEEDRVAWLKWEKTVQITNPWTIDIYIPGKPVYNVEYDSNYKTIWLRSEPGKWFICIEPVVTHANQFKESALYIELNETKQLEFTINI